MIVWTLPGVVVSHLHPLAASTPNGELHVISLAYGTYIVLKNNTLKLINL